MKDYYKILELSPAASQVEIKKSFRRLAAQYHPDTSLLPQATTLFQEINEAYQVLGNPQKRALYDLRSLHPEPTIFYQQASQPQPQRRRPPHTYRTPPVKEDNTLELIKPYVKYAQRLCFMCLCFCAVLFLDYYLPEKTVGDVLIGKSINFSDKHGKAGLAYLFGSQHKLPITGGFGDYFPVGGQISIYKTPIFSVFKRVEHTLGKHISSAVAHYNIYSPFIFMPVILIVAALVGAFNPSRPKLTFDMGIVSFFFLVIIIIVMNFD